MGFQKTSYVILFSEADSCSVHSEYQSQYVEHRKKKKIEHLFFLFLIIVVLIVVVSVSL